MAVVININDVIFDNMPVLVQGIDDAKVEAKKKEAFLTLQVPLDKSDTEVGDETFYTNQEKLLVAYYSLYLLTESHLDVTLSTEQGVVGDRVEKRLKADVTEIEYETNKNAFDSKMSLDLAKQRVCNKALEMGIALGLCREKGYIYDGCNSVKVFPLL